MNTRSEIAVPSAASSNDPAEDRRRDEVLCRLLNTPYRPIYPQRAESTAAADAAPAASEI